MSSAVTKIPKPQLRRLLPPKIKFAMFITTTITLSIGALMKVFINDRRKQQYADFYKNYDAEAEYERMRKLGLFQSG